MGSTHFPNSFQLFSNRPPSSTYLELILGPVQRDDEVDGDADNGRDGHVLAHDEETAGELLAELHAAALCELATGRKRLQWLGSAKRPLRRPATPYVWTVDDTESAPRDAAGKHAHHQRRPNSGMRRDGIVTSMEMQPTIQADEQLNVSITHRWKKNSMGRAPVRLFLHNFWMT